MFVSVSVALRVNACVAVCQTQYTSVDTYSEVSAVTLEGLIAVPLLFALQFITMGLFQLKNCEGFKGGGAI